MSTLIEAGELASRLTAANAHDVAHDMAGGSSELAVIDCRFDLTRPEWGAAAYSGGHIPTALYAHLDRDLSGPVGPGTGRHPLPHPGALASQLGRWGIDGRVQVVAYDQGNGAYAARLWWLLRWLGHPNVVVLNGGYTAWQQAGLPTESQVTPRQARTFVPHPPVNRGDRATRDPVVSTAELERAVAAGELARGESVLIDARGADRFAGQNETIDPVAGHVPGAWNHPFTRNLDSQGRFLPAQELQRKWREFLGGHSGEQVIAMCGSGVTACHNLLALEIAGLTGARLYAGSWSEWIRDPTRPLAR